MYVCTYVCHTYIHTYIYTYIHTYTHTYTHTYMYILRTYIIVPRVLPATTTPISPVSFPMTTSGLLLIEQRHVMDHTWSLRLPSVLKLEIIVTLTVPGLRGRSFNWGVRGGVATILPGAASSKTPSLWTETHLAHKVLVYRGHNLLTCLLQGLDSDLPCSLMRLSAVGCLGLPLSSVDLVGISRYNNETGYYVVYLLCGILGERRIRGNRLSVSLWQQVNHMS